MTGPVAQTGQAQTGQGGSGRPPTIWLHGAGLDASYWSPRDGGLDLPGHGARPRAPEPSVEAFADALIPDLPPLADVVGHSLGGMVAMVIAARHPARVRRLVLVETWAQMGPSWLGNLGTRVAGPLTRALGPEGVGRMGAMGQSGASKRAIREGFARLSPGGIEDAMTAASAFDGRALLPMIAAPTLVISGGKNGATAHGIAAAIPDARVQELPGGHLLPTDEPERFYAAVDAFLEAP